MVSGRYFFPKAPLLYLKWMLACAVTSVNWIGPEGLGDAEPDFLSVMRSTAITAAGGVTLATACATRLSASKGACVTVPLQPKSNAKDATNTVGTISGTSFKRVFSMSF